MSELRPEYHEILTQLSSIDWPEYSQYCSIGFGDWLDQRDTSALVSLTLNAYVANLLFLPHDMCSEYLSVAAAAAALRGKIMGGGVRMTALPNGRDGLFRKLADYIESRGGLVERTAYLSEVSIEDGHARGIRLTDGEALTGAAVAVAVPGARVGRYIDPLPDVVRTAAEYQSQLTLIDSFVATRLGEPVVTVRAMGYYSDFEGACIQAFHPIHLSSPMTVPAGDQLLVTQHYRSASDERDAEQLLIDQNEATERIFPGFEKVSIESDAWQENRYSLAAQAYGPKVPRTVEDITGLWFVGEGSEPAAGLLGGEAGAATGLSGADDIARLFTHLGS
jgi:phytoene dehydrogenase-like protein